MAVLFDAVWARLEKHLIFRVFEFSKSFPNVFQKFIKFEPPDCNF